MRASIALWLFLALANLIAATNSEIEKWNILLLNTIRSGTTPPPQVGRQLALLHVAQFEAVNSFSQSCTPYLEVGSYDPPGSNAVADPSAAQAGHDILLALYPANQILFDLALADSLVNYAGAALLESIEFGAGVAAAMLSNRSGDAAHFGDTYTVPDPLQPGDWSPTAPAFASFLLPGWGQLPLWSGAMVEDFVPSGPPAVDSEQYNLEVEEVRLLGRSTGSSRTSLQTIIADVWAGGAGTSTPPGLWFLILQQIAGKHDLTLMDEAHVYALLAIAEADAAIVAWSAKRQYHRWRPIQAIAAQEIDPEWSPYLVTPRFPAYISGHSTFSGAGARVLSNYFPSNQDEFKVCIESAAECLTYTDFETAADEAGQSRIFGGIHYQSDNQDGLAAGDALGLHTFTNCIPLLQVESVVPPPDPPIIELDALTAYQLKLITDTRNLSIASVVFAGLALIFSWAIIAVLLRNGGGGYKRVPSNSSIKAKMSDDQHIDGAAAGAFYNPYHNQPSGAYAAAGTYSNDEWCGSGSGSWVPCIVLVGLIFLFVGVFFWWALRAPFGEHWGGHHFVHHHDWI